MSPYEALLLCDPLRHHGFHAGLTLDRLAEFRAAAQAVPPELAAELRGIGATELRVFALDLPGGAVAFATLHTTTGDALEALDGLHRTSAWWRNMSALVQPHARAKPGQGWVAMEFMNLVAHKRVFPHRGSQVRKMALVAGLDPAKELLYRSLHQTNWPGVVDQMVRSNHREWTTFLIEVGERLQLFTTVEYSGTDPAEDRQSTQHNPVNQRWWSHTEPCLIPPIPGGGNWAGMELLANVTA